MEESEKILFHYTSLEGLMGIIDSKSIWATNVLYLNDASELNYSIILLRKQIHNYKDNIPIDGNWLYKISFFDSLVDNFNQLIIDTNILGFFVCSFSEEKDLLSQWRGYCPKGIGFSLGFRLSDLSVCAQQRKGLIKQCCYNEEIQISTLDNLIREISNRYDSEITSYQIGSNEQEEKKVEIFSDILMKFLELAPTFKHPKFKEEKEWRIIANRNMQSRTVIQSINYRHGQSMIVPYIEIFLPTDGEHLLIDQIIVGPTHEPKLSKASVEMLLKSKKVKFDEVQYSTIPYRPW